MACPVCYNAAAADDTVRTSINLGILLLLGVTVGVLAGFMRFIISIARRSQHAGLTSAPDLRSRATPAPTDGDSLPTGLAPKEA
jgi:hypothetical protein